MARVPTPNQSSEHPVDRVPHYAPHNEPALHLGKGGRSKAPRTVAAYRMQWLGIRQGQICGVLRCSPRAWQNYAARQRPVPGIMRAALCDRLDLDEDDLFDERGYLRALELDDLGRPAPHH